jgi:uncharacterized membrane protein YbhN (UPF0104 family)
MTPELGRRLRRSMLGALALAIVFYAGWAITADADRLALTLARFDAVALVPLIGLTLVNYGLRFVKWRLYLRQLGLPVPIGVDAAGFTAGLAMTITPGRVGELVRPWVARAATGAPYSQTLPALLADRLTDAMSMLILMGIGVWTYAREHTGLLVIGLAGGGGALLVLASAPVSDAVLGALGRLPGLGRVAPRARAALQATRVCLSPGPLAATLGLSVVAWGAECLAFWTTLGGFGAWTPVDGAIFVYAAATVLGAALPGGLGVTDGGMAGGAVALLGVDAATAGAATLLTRAGTLWMGVALGAGALAWLSAKLGDAGPPDAAR